MPFFTENPEVRVHSVLIRPPGAIPVWVSVWVKIVVSEWVSQLGGILCLFWAVTTSKTTLDSDFHILR